MRRLEVRHVFLHRALQMRFTNPDPPSPAAGRAAYSVMKDHSLLVGTLPISTPLSLVTSRLSDGL